MSENIKPPARLSYRFVLDVHLGKLARHLRMVGFDTLWKDDYTDPELLEISKTDDRILLTRDRALSESADPALCHYVKATDPDEQLIEIADHFDLRTKISSMQGFLSRCLQCNSPILPVKPHQLEDRLPGHVRLQFSEFFLCPRCERVYWKGSHFDRMWERVKLLMSKG
ncbi:MAG: Mut7-C RNAse domain-containing protein [Bdellovibrionia bacterium]